MNHLHVNYKINKVNFELNFQIPPVEMLWLQNPALLAEEV